MGLGSHIGSMIFGLYILISIIGGGFILRALFDSSDDGNKRTITLSDIQITMSKTALILYMIMSAPVIFFYLKMVSKSS